MKNKKAVITASLFLIIIVIATFSIIYLNPKRDTSVSVPDASDIQSIDMESVESSVSAVTSDIIEKIHKSNEQKIATGDVSSEIGNFYSAVKFDYLVKWYCNNILYEYGTVTDVVIFNDHQLGIFNDLNLSYASYRVYFKKSSSVTDKYVLILYGKSFNNPTKYYLIDGMITDNPYAAYPIEKSWDKIKNHAIFGKEVSELPKTVCTDSMKELDISKLIGKNRYIYTNLSLSDNYIAVINSSLECNTPNKKENWKIDYIDINTSRVSISHELQLDYNEYEVYLHSCYSDKEYITFCFKAKKAGEDDYSSIVYKAKINTDKTDEDIIKYCSPEEWVKQRWNNENNLYSESGKYYTLYKGNDLYLHNNITGKDKMIYKAYINYDTDGNENIKEASPAFFVGDIIYYNVYINEENFGTGSYDPGNNKTKFYKNDINAEFYSDGYIYGTESYCNFCYVRYNIKSPEKIETLIENNDNDPNIVYSTDKKYIITINTPEYPEYYLKGDGISTITIYNASDFKVIKTYTLSSPFSSLYIGVISDNYLYLPVVSDTSDNKAYIINLNDIE